MAWTEITRPHYVRDGLRYASDLTEAEWKLIEPLMPPRRLIGRPRKSDLRAVVNAMLYMASTGFSGGNCRGISRRGRPSKVIFMSGRAAERLWRSTTCW